MYAHKLLSYLTLLTSISTAYTIPHELQEPLMQSPPLQAPSSRRIIVRTSSNSVSGSYPLYDLLSITTNSGSISVSVTPHSASSKDPLEPASLQLKSNSGSVHVTLSEVLAEHHHVVGGGDGVFPARKYISSVSSQSGSISGSLPLGTQTALESRSGSLNDVELVVMPSNASEARRLSTVSRDGSQSVRIVEDWFWASGKEEWWHGMLSKHESQSGSINLEYPDSWIGAIEVETESGSISIVGKGVEIIRKERGRVTARKGKEGGGKVFVKAGSGKVDLRFG